VTVPRKIAEYDKVELPFMQQLAAMGWETLEGDSDVPALTYRESFRDVLLHGPLRAALLHINRAEDGSVWLDEARVNQAINALVRVGAPRLMESNVTATRLLLEGIAVGGDPVLHGGKQQVIKYIDFDAIENNRFLAINQFRVDPPGMVGGRGFRIPDIVLFVNGIPLVVVEAKAPGIPSPMEKAIRQLLMYSNQREEVEEEEGIEKLFWYNQAMVATFYYQARVSTIGATYENYVEWKHTTPYTEVHVLREVQTSPLVSQHRLVAGVLRPANLLDIVRNFTLFREAEGRTIKIVAYYQQFTAVHEAIRRLLEEPTRLKDGEFDRRGGIIWHTQGAGKSYTMVFLVRKMRTVPELRRFKVVVVTDRVDLEDQLAETMALTDEAVRRARSTAGLTRMLREEGPGLIFGMIQKYRCIVTPAQEDAGAESSERPVDTADRFPKLNESESILVLVDEAHRSHTDEWHANLLAALPTSARIGFTGTPILMGAQKRTHEIFGEFIDTYTIRQSEEDGVTVPILYEGRTVGADVFDRRDLDQLFEATFEHLTPEEREAIKNKYAREKEVLEAKEVIAEKARDMFRHYVSTVLPNHFKAQIVAVSRLAALRYQAALVEAQQELVAAIEALDPALIGLPQDRLAECDEETQFLAAAAPHLDTIRRLEFAAVISGDQHDDPSYKEWTDRAKIDDRIGRFKKPLVHSDPTRQDSLAFLCVRTMLLTGFDAPVEQALYLDRFMQGHELLQAIARVNRKRYEKTCGYVVDYYGVTRHLKAALAVYSRDDVEGALKSIKDELPRLADRHRRVLAFFGEHGVDDIYGGMDACVFLLEDERLRAEFIEALRPFLESMDIILPRPEALPYVQDAKQLGVINRTAANLYRADDLDIGGVGHKVRRLIDDHIRAYHAEITIPPIAIMDARFDDHVDEYTSPRAQAAEMAHAARYEIRIRFESDPVYYQRLSERLEAILQQFEDNWDALVEALKAYIQAFRAGRPADRTGLDPRKQSPFMSLLVDEMGLKEDELTDDVLSNLARITVEMVDLIREKIRAVDFWSTPALRQQLHAALVVYLDEQEILPYEHLDAAVDRIVSLAKRRHVELTGD